MTTGESVLETLSNEYYTLTTAEKKVADFVIGHRVETQTMSISELAAVSSVAEATITRFCRRLGYKGYNAFKLALANATPAGVLSGNPLSGEVKDDDTFDVVCQKLYTADINAMTQTLDLIRQEDYTIAADLLEKAGKVLCMGQGGSHLLAKEAAHLFSTASGKYFAIEDGHLQAIAAATADPEDVIFFFSYSGATRDMMETFQIAKKRGVKLILVTRFPKAPGASLADVVLQCGANESPLQLGSVGARIAQLFLLDVLFSELCRRNLDACRESRTRIADALSDKHL